MNTNPNESYAIAEEFSSIQGEGVYTGTPMRFIRLAGCCVGRAEKEPTCLAPMDDRLKILDGTAVKHTTCESVFGEKFICDTDYRKAYYKKPDAMLACREKHICITGGEPFMYHLDSLLQAALLKEKIIHIETSGVRPISETLARMFQGGDYDQFWITCSPKAGFLRENIPFISEWKFVVGKNFEARKIREFLNYPQGKAARRVARPVFIQPINGIHAVDPEGIRAAMKILEENPDWRLSIQMHKVLGVQ